MINLKNMEVGCASHFLDSGTFSLWTRAADFAKKHHTDLYAFYDTRPFWRYLDEYAAFIKKYKRGIDLYANVDVIPDRSISGGDRRAPELTLRNQKYLEEKHGLKPVPVVHYKEDMSWLKRYMADGYRLIALGGLVGAQEEGARSWLDRAFTVATDTRGMPVVRLHGFGITNYPFLVRYPWFSVDSASWTKVGAYGGILVPQRRKGRFVFWERHYTTDEILPLSPYLIKTALESSKKQKRQGAQRRVLAAHLSNDRQILNGFHITTLRGQAKKDVHDWLEEIKMPLGKVKGGIMAEPGVTSLHSYRKAANLLFFERLRHALPDYPFPFRHRARRGIVPL